MTRNSIVTIVIKFHTLSSSHADAVHIILQVGITPNKINPIDLSIYPSSSTSSSFPSSSSSSSFSFISCLHPGNLALQRGNDHHVSIIFIISISIDIGLVELRVGRKNGQRQQHRKVYNGIRRKRG